MFWPIEIERPKSIPRYHAPIAADIVSDDGVWTRTQVWWEGSSHEVQASLVETWYMNLC